MKARRIAAGALALSTLTVGVASPAYGSESSGKRGSSPATTTTTSWVGSGSGSDSHEVESHEDAGEVAKPVTTSSAPRSPGSSGSSGSTGSAGYEASRAALIASLDRLAARVSGASIDEAVRAELLEAIAAARAAAEAGGPLDKAQLGRLTSRVAHALESHHDGSDDGTDDGADDGSDRSTTETTETTEKPETTETSEASGRSHGVPAKTPKALAALDHARDRLNSAAIDADAKARALEALARARAEVEAQVGQGGDGAAALHAHVEARLAELRDRLSRMVVRLEAFAQQAAAAHPDDPRVQQARDALASAADALPLVDSPAELRLIWAQLRDARALLAAVMGGSTSATTTTTSATS